MEKDEETNESLAIFIERDSQGTVSAQVYDETREEFIASFESEEPFEVVVWLSSQLSQTSIINQKPAY